MERTKVLSSTAVCNSSLKMAVYSWYWDLQHHSTDIKEKLVRQKRRGEKKRSLAANLWLGILTTSK